MNNSIVFLSNDIYIFFVKKYLDDAKKIHMEKYQFY